MKRPRADQCGSCYFFQDVEPGTGYCVRHAPRPTGPAVVWPDDYKPDGPPTCIDVAWPRVENGWWCGEFKRWDEDAAKQEDTKS